MLIGISVDCSTKYRNAAKTHALISKRILFFVRKFIMAGFVTLKHEA